MSLHIVHFIGPINHNAACPVRNLCLQALQSGAAKSNCTCPPKAAT